MKIWIRNSYLNSNGIECFTLNINVMITLKLIKKKDFDTNGVKGTAYTCAKSGRVLNVSSLSFDNAATDLVVDDKAMTLTINTDVEVVSRPYVDLSTGESLNGLVVLPKFGMDIAKF